MCVVCPVDAAWEYRCAPVEIVETILSIIAEHDVAIIQRIEECNGCLVVDCVTSSKYSKAFPGHEPPVFELNRFVIVWEEIPVNFDSHVDGKAKEKATQKAVTSDQVTFDHNASLTRGKRDEVFLLNLALTILPAAVTFFGLRLEERQVYPCDWLDGGEPKSDSIEQRLDLPVDAILEQFSWGFPKAERGSFLVTVIGIVGSVVVVSGRHYPVQLCLLQRQQDVFFEFGDVKQPVCRVIGQKVNPGRVRYCLIGRERTQKCIVLCSLCLRTEG